MGRLANLPTLIAAAIARVCRVAGTVGVFKRVAPAEAAVAPGIGHALLEGIEAAVRSNTRQINTDERQLHSLDIQIQALESRSSKTICVLIL
jgi:uncharacterized membrane protein